MALAWQRLRIEADRIACAPPYSFYHDFIPRFWAGGDDEVGEAPIHRICTLSRKMGVGSLLLEDAADRPEVMEEIRHLEENGRGPTDGDWSAAAITFLMPGASLDATECTAADLIAQVVVLTFPGVNRPRSYVYEAAVRLCTTNGGDLLLNNHIHLERDQGVLVAGRTLMIGGSYFCQQNGVTSLCGHTAVRTVVMNLTGERVAVGDLNREWGFDADARRLPQNAVEDALRSRGFHVVCYGFTNRRPRGDSGDDGTWTVLSRLVESGTPSLLVMSTGPRLDHVVPLIGHTVNTDEWHPQGADVHLSDERGTTSSSLWIDHLVLNDDQLGPYYCLSRAGLFEKSDHASAVRPQRVVTVLPEGADVSPLAAETLARGGFRGLLTATLRWCQEPPRWLSFLAETRERHIFRTILIDRKGYLEDLRSRPEVRADASALSILDTVASALPERFWMVEVSLPNIMLANRARLAEMLISISGGDQVSILAHRMPGTIATIAGDEMNLFRLPVVTHVPMHSMGRNGNRW